MPALSEEITDEEKIIFRYTKPKIYNEKKIIYLCEDALPQNARYDDFKMISALERVKDITVIRPHPNQKFSIPNFDIDKSDMSWELLVSDIDDIILISEFSTAMFTPYTLYNNKKFILIFLYRIMNNSFEHRDKLVFALQKTTPNVYIPNTFEEYNKLIEKLVL